MSTHFLKLSLPVAIMMISTTSVDGVWRFMKGGKPRPPPTSSPVENPADVPPGVGGIDVIIVSVCNGSERNNDCPEEVPYCVATDETANTTVCSACTPRLSCTDRNTPYCVSAFTLSGYACATCMTNSSVGCTTNETCGKPWCIPDAIESCSEDHDASCPPTSAPN